MNEIVKPEVGQTDKVENTDADPFAPGNWFWYKSDNKDTDEWLGCITRHGSNYVHIQGVGDSMYTQDERVHVNDIYRKLRAEPNAERIIENKIGFHQQEVNRLLGRIKETTARLGVVPRTAISDHNAGGDNALAVVSSQVDTESYKKELVKAKETDLPALFKAVEAQHKLVATWMKAPILPMMASIGPMKDCIKDIEDRVYTIELYAGLTEYSRKVKDGDPAKTDTVLHVMQRKHYMDEECLLDYDAGGMEFKDLTAFADWLAKPTNFDRLLPFERCAVAFQVRRTAKERSWDSPLGAFINIQLEQQDKWTYLFVRNGEQLWMIGCDFEFGDRIFPDATEFDPANGGYMMKMFAGKTREIITRNEYEVAVAEYEKELTEWEADPDAKHYNKPRLPHDMDRVEPLDPSSVYYDDGLAMVDAEVKAYNRIAVILQGLFDRSLCLHPHPPVSVWDNASFQRSVKLVYDATSLTYGDAPDFEAYAAGLRKSLDVGSVTIGQDHAWMVREAARENSRTANSWREKPSYHDTFRPYNDPGPGYLAKVETWKPRARKAVFRWQREAKDWRNHGHYYDATVEVDAADLFNVSAYQPGDYLKFFKDPRTRANYLTWAKYLLKAEAFHAGKETVNDGPRYND